MLGNRRQSRGAAMVEFQIVALFALLPLCLGMLQLALLVAENHHVDHATFQAARRASMASGDLEAARRAFAQAASVLFVDAGTELNADNAVARVAGAYARALLDQGRFSRFQILSPAPEAQADFAVRRDRWRVIPSDGLEYRSSAPGPRSGVSIQQANVLRLQVRWCRPLIVPLIRELMIGTLRLLDRDPWHQYCYSEGRVPIRSEGTSLMQSDFRVSS